MIEDILAGLALVGCALGLCAIAIMGLAGELHVTRWSMQVRYLGLGSPVCFTHVSEYGEEYKGDYIVSVVGMGEKGVRIYSPIWNERFDIDYRDFERRYEEVECTE